MHLFLGLLLFLLPSSLLPSPLQPSSRQLPSCSAPTTENTPDPDAPRNTLSSSALQFYCRQWFKTPAGKRLVPVAEHCEFIAMNIIPRSGGDALRQQSWGYPGFVDKLLPESGYWAWGLCVVAVMNADVHTKERGIFSLLEVGLTAGRIIQVCIDPKNPYGGTSHIALVEQSFLVYVGGPENVPDAVINGSRTFQIAQGI